MVHRTPRVRRDDLAIERHSVHTLVWFEVHEDMMAAIAREKAIKGWKRRWKLELIEAANPSWRDLYVDLL